MADGDQNSPRRQTLMADFGGTGTEEKLQMSWAVNFLHIQAVLNCVQRQSSEFDLFPSDIIQFKS